MAILLFLLMLALLLVRQAPLARGALRPRRHATIKDVLTGFLRVSMEFSAVSTVFLFQLATIVTFVTCAAEHVSIIMRLKVSFTAMARGINLSKKLAAMCMAVLSESVMMLEGGSDFSIHMVKCMVCAAERVLLTMEFRRSEVFYLLMQATCALRAAQRATPIMALGASWTRRLRTTARRRRAGRWRALAPAAREGGWLGSPSRR